MKPKARASPKAVLQEGDQWQLIYAVDDIVKNLNPNRLTLLDALALIAVGKAPGPFTLTSETDVLLTKRAWALITTYPQPGLRASKLG